MFEKIVTELLNRYLSDYVCDLNAEQLRLGIWGGNVVFRNLKLREDALAGLDLPIAVKRGYIGQLTVQIPWKRLWSDPIVVDVDRLFLVAVPDVNRSYDAGAADASQQSAKEKRAHEYEDAREAKARVDAGEDASQKNTSFVEKLVTKMIDNIQVSVRNVHVRYEDTLSSPKHPFALGVTLKAMSVQSTDGEWRPFFITGASPVTHKLGSILCLGAYLNSDTEMLLDVPFDRFEETMLSLIGECDRPVAGNKYLMKPATAVTHITLNRSPLEIPDVPKLSIGLSVDRISALLNLAQYRDVTCAADLFSRQVLNEPFRRFRPSVPLLGNEDEWWHYACKSVMVDVHRRHEAWSWKRMKKRRETRLTYLRTYKSWASEGRPKTGVSRESVAAMDRDLTIEDILLYRQLAEAQMAEREMAGGRSSSDGGAEGGGDEKKALDEGAHPVGWKDWVTSWVWSTDSYSPTSAARAHRPSGRGIAMSDQQRKELYAAIDYDDKVPPGAELAGLPPNYVAQAVTARIGTFSISLFDNTSGDGPALLVAGMEVVSSTFQRRPLSEGFDVEVDVQNAGMTNESLRQCLFPHILRPLKRVPLLLGDDGPMAGYDNATDNLAVFNVRFELNPINHSADSMLNMKMQPFDVTYSKTTIERLVAFFTVPQDVHLDSLATAARKGIEELKVQTRAGLEYAILTHKTLLLTVDFAAPRIIVAETSTRSSSTEEVAPDENVMLLVVDLGRLQMTSDIAPVDPRRIQQVERMIDLMYDRFDLTLTDVHVLLGSAKELKMAAMKDADIVDLDRSADVGLQQRGLNRYSLALGKDVPSSLRLLEDVSMNLRVKLSVQMYNPDLARFIIEGTLPQIRLNVSDRSYRGLLRLSTALPDTEPARSTAAVEAKWDKDRPASVIPHPSRGHGKAHTVLSAQTHDTNARGLSSESISSLSSASSDTLSSVSSHVFGGCVGRKVGSPPPTLDEIVEDDEGIRADGKSAAMPTPDVAKKEDDAMAGLERQASAVLTPPITPRDGLGIEPAGPATTRSAADDEKSHVPVRPEDENKSADEEGKSCRRRRLRVTIPDKASSIEGSDAQTIDDHMHRDPSVNAADATDTEDMAAGADGEHGVIVQPRVRAPSWDARSGRGTTEGGESVYFSAVGDYDDDIANDDTSHSPSPPSKPAYLQVQVQLDFEIGEVSILVSRWPDTVRDPSPVVSLTIRALGVNVVKRAYDMDVDAKLDSLLLLDLIKDRSAGTVLLTSSMDVAVASVHRDHPNTDSWMREGILSHDHSDDKHASDTTEANVKFFAPASVRDRLVQVHVTLLDVEAPEVREIAPNAESPLSIDAKFGEIYAIVDEVSFASILDYVVTDLFSEGSADIAAAAAANRRASVGQSNKHKHHQNHKEATASHRGSVDVPANRANSAGNSHHRSRKSKVKFSSTLFVSAALGRVGVLLRGKRRDVARARIEDFTGSVRIGKRKTEVIASLGAVAVVDMTGQGELYKTIVSASGGRVVDLRFVQYDRPAASLLQTSPAGAKPRRHDMSVNMRTHGLQVFLLKRFVLDVLEFADDISTSFSVVRAEKLFAARTDSSGDVENGTPNEGAGPTTTSATPSTSAVLMRIKLDIDIRAPTCIVPRSSRSREVLVVDLGRVRIFSQFPDPHSEQLGAAFSQARLAVCEMGTDTTRPPRVEHMILDGFDARAIVKRSLNQHPSAEGSSEVTISVQFEGAELALNVANTDIILITQIIGPAGNLLEDTRVRTAGDRSVAGIDNVAPGITVAAAESQAASTVASIAHLRQDTNSASASAPTATPVSAPAIPYKVSVKLQKFALLLSSGPAPVPEGPAIIAREASISGLREMLPDARRLHHAEMPAGAFAFKLSDDAPGVHSVPVRMIDGPRDYAPFCSLSTEGISVVFGVVEGVFDGGMYLSRLLIEDIRPHTQSKFRRLVWNETPSRIRDQRRRKHSAPAMNSQIDTMEAPAPSQCPYVDASVGTESLHNASSLADGSTTGANPDSDAFAVSLKSSPDSYFVSVELCHPRIMINTDFVVACAVFIQPVLAALATKDQPSQAAKSAAASAAAAKRKSAGKDPQRRRRSGSGRSRTGSSADGTQGTADAKPVSSSSWQIHVALNSPEIVIIGDATDSNTHALSMRMDFRASCSSSYGQQNVDMSVARLSIASYITSNRDGSTMCMLEPCAVRGWFKSYPAPMGGGVYVDPLRMTLSYLDVKTILVIVNSVTEGISLATAISASDEAIATAQLAVPVDPPLHPRSLNDDVWYIDEEEEEASTMEAAAFFGSVLGRYGLEQQGDAPDEPTASNADEGSGEKFEFNMDEIEIKVINNCSASWVPVISLRLSVTGRVTDWSGTLRGEGCASIVASYYNELMSAWEPLIEPIADDNGVRVPWSLSGEVTTKKDSNGSILSFSALEAERRLEVTLTHQFLTSMKKTLDCWSQDYATDRRIVHRREPFYPFHIRNHTGLDAEFALTAEVDDGSRMVNLPPGQTLPLKFCNLTKVARSPRSNGSTGGVVASYIGGSKAHEGGEITVKFRGWDPIENIRVDKVGLSVINLTPPRKGVTMRLVVDVELSNGVKIATLRSSLMVENATGLPMDIAYEIPSDSHGRPEYLDTVPPGQRYAVPLLVAYHALLRVRPAGLAYVWSNRPFSWMGIGLGSMKDVVPCFPDVKANHVPGQPSPRPFMLQAHIRADRMARSQPFEDLVPYHTITLYPPIVIRNLLPRDVRFCIIDGETGTRYPTPRTLGPGDSVPMYEVNLEHELCMSVELIGVGETPKRPLVNSPSGRNLGTTLRFPATHNNSELRLGLENCPIKGSGGARSVTIFCPYWFVNRTGLPLEFKEEGRDEDVHVRPRHTLIEAKSGLASGVSVEGEMELFSFSADMHLLGRPKACARVAQCPWGYGFNVDAVGSAGVLSIEGTMGPVGRGGLRRQHELSVTISFAAHRLTKVVMFRPRFLFVNGTADPVEIAPSTSDGEPNMEEIVHVKPGKSVPFYFPGACQRTAHLRRIGAVTTCWTSAFAIESPGSTALRTVIPPNGTEERRRVVAMRVEVTIEDASVVITVRAGTTVEPVRIENRCVRQAVRFRQTGCHETHTLAPGMAFPYVYDSPTGARQIAWTVLDSDVGEDIVDMDQMEVSSITHDTLPIWAVSFPDGPTRVLLFTDNAQIVSHIEETFGMSMREQYQRRSVGECVRTWARGRLAGLGLSIVGAQPMEIIYLTMENVSLDYVVSDQNAKTDLYIGQLQIDNQLKLTHFPTLLAASPMPSSTAADLAEKESQQNESQPHLQASRVAPPFARIVVVRAQGLASHADTVDYIRYVSALVMPFDVKLEETLVLRLLEFSGVWQMGGGDDDASGNEEDADAAELRSQFKRAQQSLTKPITADELVGTEKAVYIELMELHPLKINATFRLELASTDVESDPSYSHAIRREVQHDSPVKAVIRSIGLTVSDIDGAPIRLNALYINNVYGTRQDILDRMGRHYMDHLLGEVLKVLGCIDILGNPVGIVTSLGTGVRDFFYEPWQVALSGEGDFGESLSKGAKSLVTHTAQGTVGAMSRFTKSIGKGMAAITMDNKYQEKRREQLSEVPHDFAEGLARGGKRFVRGIAGGVTGLIKMPVQGAQSDGVEGFFKGVGRGLVGVVVKPIGGLVDLATGTLEGVLSMVHMLGTVERKRCPRFIAVDKMIRPYQRHESVGAFVLARVHDGAFKGDTYVGHCEYETPHGDRRWIYFTDERVMLLAEDRVGGKMSVEWQLPFAMMISHEKKGYTLVFEGRFQTLLKTYARRKVVANPLGQQNPERTMAWMVQKYNEAWDMWSRKG